MDLSLPAFSPFVSRRLQLQVRRRSRLTAVLPGRPDSEPAAGALLDHDGPGAGAGVRGEAARTRRGRHQEVSTVGVFLYLDSKAFRVLLKFLYIFFLLVSYARYNFHVEVVGFLFLWPNAVLIAPLYRPEMCLF